MAGSTTVTDATFDGNPYGGTAAVTGAGVLIQPVVVTYTGIYGTVYGPSTTPRTNAGKYKAEASFGGDANHTGSSDSKNYTINKAAASISLSGLGTFFDGQPHAATARTNPAGLLGGEHHAQSRGDSAAGGWDI